LRTHPQTHAPPPFFFFFHAHRKSVADPVDREGYEENVFEGFDISYWRPKLLIVELHNDHPDIQQNRSLIESAKRVRDKL